MQRQRRGSVRDQARRVETAQRARCAARRARSRRETPNNTLSHPHRTKALLGSKACSLARTSDTTPIRLTNHPALAAAPESGEFSAIGVPARGTGMAAPASRARPTGGMLIRRRRAKRRRARVGEFAGVGVLARRAGAAAPTSRVCPAAGSVDPASAR